LCFYFKFLKIHTVTSAVTNSLASAALIGVTTDQVAGALFVYGRRFHFSRSLV
jgi:hypothetical protein